jgi:hypothetical protein
VDEIDEAMHVLAEKGIWARAAAPDGESFRTTLRGAAKARDVHIVTGYGPDGTLVAQTVDGWPAEEPYRSAAQRLYGSDVPSFAPIADRVPGSRSPRSCAE